MAAIEGVSVVDVDWTNDDEVRDFALRACQVKETENAEIERQADLNNQWVQGRQELFWNQRLNRLVQQENPNGRVRAIYNLLWAPVEALVAKLSASGGGLTATPATDDLADYDAAFIQARVLAHYAAKLKWEILLGRWDREVIICTETFAKVVWDPTAGDPYSTFTPEDVGMDQAEFKKTFGAKDIEGLREGDVVIVPRNIFQIFWGPVGTAFDDAEWVLEVVDRSKACVKERYGLDPAEVKASFSSGVRVWRGGMGARRGASERQGDPGKTRVLELWLRHNRAVRGLEEGRHVVVAGEKVPINTKNPYDHGEIPISRYPLVFVPGEIRSNTWVSSALPLQRDANQALGQACENRERVANPRVWVQERALVDQTQYYNRSGGLVEYRGRDAPVERPVQDHHRAAVTALEVAKVGIDDLAGIRAVSQGRAGPSVRSAAQVSLLQNQDDERLGEVVKQRREFHRRNGRLLLATLHQFAEEERTVRVLGEESTRRTMLFTRHMLGPVDKPIRLDRYNVAVEPDMPPRSRGALRQDMETLIGRGFLKPENPDHQAFVFDTMQMGVARREPDRQQRAVELQHERNRLMALGEYEPPRWYEPLMLMQMEMRRFQTESVFRQLSPERRALFMAYEEELIRQRVMGQVYQRAVMDKALAELGIKPDQGQRAPMGQGRQPLPVGQNPQRGTPGQNPQPIAVGA